MALYILPGRLIQISVSIKSKTMIEMFDLSTEE